ncbi:two-component system chemotaxis sensor kinase CheA [Sphingomonas sp. SORGH_AS802]|uniref:chemotaxis protein CheA n=1 Tax=unclassified Sphingomonas TaxID=196159 RepID=UPI0028631969|nr:MULTISPECIES: chemotaxis protein CheA [unclassified Sphingomonas]MDR6125384.1 two-component system chemotaxis sensor kinase CheA [Sphingomonas sp. SORGH_AS_0438]MDR6134001.1 two-component system chemotaxis sensor kinase CheA [Sphingomonas sp. SORGH_AS_0802]
MSDDLDDIQAIFFEECAEGLATAEAGLSAMAAGDVSAGVIAGVFRAVHSIKGGAGAFGHTALTAFAHRFENVLDEVRANRIAPTPGVTRVMLSAFDILSDHCAAAQGTAAVPADAAMLAVLEEVLATGGAPDQTAATPAPAPEPVPAAPVDEDPFGFQPVAIGGLEDFDLAPSEPAGWTVRFTPSNAAMAHGGEPLLVLRELELLGGQVTAADLSALPPLAELDPEMAYIGWTITLPAEVAEDAITECFDFVAPDSVIEIVRCGGDPAPAPEASTPAPAAEPVEATAPAAPAPSAAPAPVVAAVPSVPAPAAKPATDDAPPPRQADPVAQSIRVELTKLDMLLNLVGELVIRSSILSDRLSPKDQERVELPQLSRLTREIQDTVMSLRAQPIKQAFSRVPRMLRDLSSATGKQVELETFGETTEVDKGVIEKIGDPLTHMIRNAVDHGVELPADRIAAGKPAHGTIRLSAEQRGARIFVRVADDGRGIDRARVRAKAVEKGIIAADAVLTDEEIDQLICAPGFSTAETISNISGRGVGMDVVRSNVEALGGRVEITSMPGKGTVFTMILPLTLAILEGMIVRLAGQRFVLPLANVVETVQPEPGQVKPISTSGEVLELRGNFLPVRRLGNIFGFASNDALPPEESLVIVVESESAGHVGLMVDTIDDRREVVIKSLDQNLHPIRGLGGATILGDGSIALILDIEAMVASSNPRFIPKGLAA